MKMFRIKYLFAISFILLGISLLAENFGVNLGITFGRLINLIWPLFIVFWGLELFSSTKFFINRAFGILLMLLGGSFLISNMWFIDLDLSFVWSNLWALLLIVVGISFLRGHNGNRKEKISIFQNMEVAGNDYEEHRKSYLAIWGGIDLDLRNAPKDAPLFIEATAIMGGMDIIVPDDMKIICSGNATLGGISINNKDFGGLYYPIDEIIEGNEPIGEIHIDANVLMGGIDIHIGDKHAKK